MAIHSLPAKDPSGVFGAGAFHDGYRPVPYQGDSAAALPVMSGTGVYTPPAAAPAEEEGGPQPAEAVALTPEEEEAAPEEGAEAEPSEEVGPTPGKPKKNKKA